MYVEWLWLWKYCCKNGYLIISELGGSPLYTNMAQFLRKMLDLNILCTELDLPSPKGVQDQLSPRSSPSPGQSKTKTAERTICEDHVLGPTDSHTCRSWGQPSIHAHKPRPQHRKRPTTVMHTVQSKATKPTQGSGLPDLLPWKLVPIVTQGRDQPHKARHLRNQGPPTQQRQMHHI